MPHEDIPDRRFEIVSGIAGVLLLAAVPAIWIAQAPPALPRLPVETYPSAMRQAIEPVYRDALAHPAAFGVLVVSFVLGVTLHGAAQAWVARWRGDRRPAPAGPVGLR